MVITSIRYAVHAADQSRVRQLDGISGTTATHIPAAGDRIKSPFLVDPGTLEPVELIVSDVLHDYSPDYVVVVVTRPQ